MRHNKEAGREAEHVPFLDDEETGPHISVPTHQFDFVTDRFGQKKSKYEFWVKWVTIMGSAILSALVTFGIAAFVINYVRLETYLHSSSASKSSYLSKVFHNETIPTTPRIRPMSDYVLSPPEKYHESPVTHHYTFTVVSAKLNPDGVYRDMFLINNQFPGPLIEVNQGDRLVVTVDNRAENATAIHFHGLFQNGTNHMDGTVGSTSCPIAPGTSYTYNFTVDGQHGTYWYHSHQSAQAGDGLFGPLVIHSAEEKTLQQVPYASDRVLMFSDHYQDTTSSLLMDYLAPGRENEEPVPDSALINGRGVRQCSEFPHRECDDSAVAFPEVQLERGKNHRLRILNTGAFATFQVELDAHEFMLTEVDGTDVEPTGFHRLEIMPAQRYSIVVNATEEADEFWLRGRFVTHCFRHDNDYMKPTIEGIVRYVDAPVKNVQTVGTGLPTSTAWSESIEVACKDMNDTLLHPVSSPPMPPATDYVKLKAAFHIGDWTLARGFFNQSSWLMNATYPSLHRILDAEDSMLTLANERSVAVNDILFTPKTEFVLQTEGIQVLDIAINNFDDGSHPFHLHGHKFFVMTPSTTGYPPVNMDALAVHLEQHGLKNPVLRDTVTVQAYQWVIIRVVLDNPGIWALHCHNMWHAESGMAMQVLVRGSEVKEWASGVGEVEREMCRRPGVTLGSRPSDDIWEGVF